MSLEIKALSSFERDVKKLFKKYKQLSNDLKVLKVELTQNPKSGVELGNGCYKIRLANSSIPTGKSGGFRVIYYYIDKENNLYLMSMYSKSEIENIDEKIILNILKENNLL
jgi:mRNA-degrading endonuclease RelE of RelBE toxin-antitoxin system